MKEQSNNSTEKYLVEANQGPISKISAENPKLSNTINKGIKHKIKYIKIVHLKEFYIYVINFLK